MPQYAILHAATRVIRRLTTDDPPPMATGEVAMVYVGGFPTPSYWKLLADGALQQASVQEISDAGVDAGVEHAKQQAIEQAFRDALDDVIANVVLQPKMKVFLERFRDRLGTP